MPRSKRLSCGVQAQTNPETGINALLDVAMTTGFDFIVVPLAHPLRALRNPAAKGDAAFARADLDLYSGDWSSSVVGQISSTVQTQLDSADPAERIKAQEMFEQDTAWASHISLPAVVLPLTVAPVAADAKAPRSIANLARVLSNFLNSTLSMTVWVRVTATPMAGEPSSTEANAPVTTRAQDSWELWNTLRTLCGYNGRLAVALELPDNLPSPQSLARWKGEPVKGLFCLSSSFLTNNKGFPVLSKRHQLVVREFLEFGTQVVVDCGSNQFISPPDAKAAASAAAQASPSGKGKGKGKAAQFVDNTTTPTTIYENHLQYIGHLFDTLPALDEATRASSSFEDSLQAPLQPLMDNLESATYEVFERDPVKYAQYGRAVELALEDRVPESERATRETVIMVVGAGRGPLVQAALEAAERANCKVKVYAVEKNPNAVATLLVRKNEEWLDSVEIIESDMRAWNPPALADILVSELLGSFGDNELSPECLDGAQRLLKPDGVSIPSKYTSYLAPLSSQKLYIEVRNQYVHFSPPDERKAFETPYVVLLKNAAITNPPVPVFTFEHPNRAAKIDNSRYTSVTFTAPHNTTLHGFAGYFDTVLYKDVMLSIVPDTFSTGMFSWFPILFPFKQPVSVKADETIEIHVWRNCTREKVWYEWTCTSPISLPIHNPGGRSYYIGL
ncbi:protein arginine methyltransferase 5 [Capsaspora owczarzaki ATCC 30864]|uniref:Protein arginine N-methyltransferase n=1 Tax=Capsaspora owczarzaki (strain ATCC 30864) TaxID=595528 RepID=A0A0D2VW08_CAPO3|nr:protein arginine methyltransferase 5 [Capsaspora owczarzaki ATCC 30864]KJE95677.1 protein arginine methyltransferase 5 [Capsaspora owczarzaki ATCC 30864]|eukprot:XP_004345694.1 protein arginine methyltransferase 5 [Capsaspora owczarzaki ATCC 30864]